jgi:hypothetical protein
MSEATRSESIIKIIKEITDNRIIMPEFQRDFVWEISRTFDLFDSIFREIFIGTIIYGIPSFEITCRQIDIRPRKRADRRRKPLEHFSLTPNNSSERIDSKRLLLDGQQRMTAIYRAIKGHDDVWIIFKPNNEHWPQNLQDFSSIEKLFSQIQGQEDEVNLSIKISDSYKIWSDLLDEEEQKNNYFDKLLYIQNLHNLERKNEEFKRYRKLNQLLYKIFSSERVLSYHLLDMSTEKFALFFERSNSKLITLNFIDILRAKLYKGFNLRKKVVQFEESNNQIKLDQEVITRALAFIISQGGNVDQSYILKDLTTNHFIENWDEICQLFKNVLLWLSENKFIFSQSWIPYTNMIIPLMVFLKEIGGDFSMMSENQKEFITYWYWMSIFSQRYSGASNQFILDDSKALISIANNRKFTNKNYINEKFQIQFSDKDTLISYNKKRSSIYKGVLNFIGYKSNGLRDWNNTSFVGTFSKLEDHHIFPQGFLNANLPTNEDEVPDFKLLIDSVINRALIPKITNIKIGKKKPSEYLKKIKERNNKLEQSLENQFIPTELINGSLDNKYENFLAKRAQKLLELINDETVNKKSYIKQTFVDV